MTRPAATCVLALTLAGMSAVAQTCATAPTSSPATTTAQAPAADAAAMEILKQQEAAGQKYATIQGDLTMEVVDRIVGDSEIRSGWVVYKKAMQGSPAKFRLHFKDLKLGAGPVSRNQLDHAFDGHYWSVAKHEIRNITRYQVAAEGEQVDPMRLGKGPFPLPFGQQADEVLKYCQVQTRPLGADEPKDTVYLELTTRRQFTREIAFSKLQMWIDPKTYLPVKLISQDGKKKTTTVTFPSARTNVKIDDSKEMFYMPKPAGWSEDITRLEKEN